MNIFELAMYLYRYFHQGKGGENRNNFKALSCYVMLFKCRIMYVYYLTSSDCNFKFLSGMVTVDAYYIISVDELFLALEEVFILRRYLFEMSK